VVRAAYAAAPYRAAAMDNQERGAFARPILQQAADLSGSAAPPDGLAPRPRFA
jgi:hypothetical protein